MPAAERLEMRTITSLGVVENRDNKTANISPPDPASRLDVLGDSLGLPIDQHETQSGNVHTDADHICRKNSVDSPRKPDFDVEKVEHPADFFLCSPGCELLNIAGRPSFF